MLNIALNVQIIQDHDSDGIEVELVRYLSHDFGRAVAVL